MQAISRKRYISALLSLVLALGIAMPAQVANAATTTIVTPLSADWVFINDNGTTGDHTTGFETGPSTPPAGTGSAYITLNSSAAGIVLFTQKYQGTRLDAIEALTYSTYTNLSPTAMTFQINYDPDITDANTPWYGRLTYEPYMNGTVTNGSWQTWDMLNGGAGKWWASPNANTTLDTTCGQSSPCTLTAILALFPNIGIRADANSGIMFKAGSNWNGFDGNIDNLNVQIAGNLDTYNFEPLTDVYVDDSWSAVTPGTDPDGAGPALLYGVDSFSTIQEGIDTVGSNGTVHVADGTYTEDLTIDKAVDLLGPNAGINPNSEIRTAEAIIHPATSNPDPAICSVMAYLGTSDITIKGFAFDGDNPSITSGIIIGTADVDACEILAGYEGMGNITVENNILNNATYTGIDFYNYTNASATSGNYIRYNLIENVGTPTYGYGMGILVYNNFYADITNNVFDNVRVGIQTGNYSQANPGTTGSISNNEIHSWRLGIFHNLWYGKASNIPVSNNVIDVVDKAGTPRWAGISLSSFSVPATIGPNTITATNVSQQTVGYMIWNDYLASGLSVTGGTVTGADYGVWVNNYAGYSSNADSTSIIVDNITISGASLAGIYVQDDPLNTNNATVQAMITNSPIRNSAVGVLVEGSDASATGSCNQITGNTAGVNNTTSTVLDFENNWWGFASGPSGVGPGSGDSVSANVDYTPWNISKSCTSSGADTTGVFRPSNGALYLKHKNETGFADVQINYGLGGDYPVVGDWDGDGDATIGIYRNGSFYLRNENTIGFADVVFPFGVPGDQPVAGDWDGDGDDTIGVYRNGTFFLRNSNDTGAPEMTFGLGVPGDVGIAGDWDGDGMDTTGVFRPSNGALYLKNRNETGYADIQINYGIAGDKPVVGDWDGDGDDTIGIYRDGAFYLRNENTIGFADWVFALGIPGDHPIAGNWDGQP